MHLYSNCECSLKPILYMASRRFSCKSWIIFVIIFSPFPFSHVALGSAVKINGAEEIESGKRITSENTTATNTTIENQEIVTEVTTLPSETVTESITETSDIHVVVESVVCEKCGETRTEKTTALIATTPTPSAISSEASQKPPENPSTPSVQLLPANGSEVILRSRLLLNSQNIQQVSNDVTTKGEENQKQIKETNDVISSSDLIDQLDEWNAPEFLKKGFPYYLSGYDDEERPIWIGEYGKYDIRKVVEEGEPNVSLLEEYAKQAAYRILKSIRDRNQVNREEGDEETEAEVSEAWYILDMDGITISQLTHPETMIFKLKVVRAFRDIFVDHLAGIVIINANYVAHSLINFFRPVFGRVMEKVEIYGTQPTKWIPRLRRMFPIKSLPTWYGGNPNYSPIRVYG